MKRTAALYVLTILFLFSISEAAEYPERENAVNADSILIRSAADSVKSDYVKEELKLFLQKISSSKKIFHKFPVDVYKRNKFKYNLSYKQQLTINEILDSLSAVTGKARILRINKVDLDNGDGKKLALSDNSFKDLAKEPSYKNKDTLLDIIEKTALRPNQKSSLEWIWGKSPESDAYFSTKLTFYDDQFSLYPEYRFFIGNDEFRDPKSWFFTLENYPPPAVPVIAEIKKDEPKPVKEEAKQEIIAEVIKPDKIEPEPVEKKAEKPVKEEPVIAELPKEEIKSEIKEEIKIEKPVKEEIKPVKEEIKQEIIAVKPEVKKEEKIAPEKPEFDCGGSGMDAADFILDAEFYEKKQDGILQSVSRRVNSADMLKEFFKNDTKIKFIRLTGSDFIFEGNEVRKSNSETVIEVAGDINACTSRLSNYLSQGISEPNKKRSIELITGSNKDKLSYNAVIITVYDGQTTVFTEYKVYASTEVRKDRNSWFNKL